MIQIVLLHALFGASIPVSKWLLSHIGAMWLTGLRMSLAGILLLTYNRFQKSTFTLQWAHWWYYVQIIFFGIYVKYMLRYWGLSYMSASKMSFLLNISPCFAALFSYLAFREKLSLKQWIGLAIGFIGITPLLLITSPAEQLVGEITVFSLPELAILFAVASHAYSIIIMRRLVRENNYSASMTNGIRMLGGGLLAAATAGIFEGPIVIDNPAPFFLWLGLLVVVSNIICHNFYIHLLKYYSATFLAFTDFLAPFFTALYCWLFFNEQITWHYYVSGLVVFVGLFLFYQEELFLADGKQQKTMRDFVPQWLVQIGQRYALLKGEQ